MTFLEKYYGPITIVTQFLTTGIVYVGVAWMAKKVKASSTRGNSLSAIVCVIMALIGLKIALYAPVALGHHRHWAQGLSATWYLWTTCACLAARMLADRAAQVPILKSYAIASVICAALFLVVFISVDK